MKLLCVTVVAELARASVGPLRLVRVDVDASVVGLVVPATCQLLLAGHTTRLYHLGLQLAGLHLAAIANLLAHDPHDGGHAGLLPSRDLAVAAGAGVLQEKGGIAARLRHTELHLATLGPLLLLGLHGGADNLLLLLNLPALLLGQALGLCLGGLLLQGNPVLYVGLVTPRQLIEPGIVDDHAEAVRGLLATPAGAGEGLGHGDAGNTPLLKARVLVQPSAVGAGPRGIRNLRHHVAVAVAAGVGVRVLGGGDHEQIGVAELGSGGPVGTLLLPRREAAVVRKGALVRAALGEQD